MVVPEELALYITAKQDWCFSCVTTLPMVNLNAVVISGWLLKFTQLTLKYQLPLSSFPGLHSQKLA